MKELRFRIFLILLFFGVSVYLLYPTYSDYQNGKEIEKRLENVRDSIKKANPEISKEDLRKLVSLKESEIIAGNPDYSSAREKRMKLGLDLQGGMYLVMEVNTTEMLKKLARDPDEVFLKTLAEASKELEKSNEDLVSVLARKLQEKNIRLSRYFGSLRDEDSDIISRLQEQEKDAVSRAKEIIANRVDQYGVSEPSITQQGSRRLIVELPGIAKEEEAKKLLQGSALLEFKLVKDPNFAFPIIERIDQVLAGKVSFDSTGAAVVDSTKIKSDSTKSNDPNSEAFKKDHPFFSIAWPNAQSGTADLFVQEKNKDIVLALLERPEVKKIIPDNVEFLFDAKPMNPKDPEKVFRLYMVNKNAELTGGVVEDARANIDPQTSQPEVSMEMNSEGAMNWSRITGANIGKRCAVVLDGFVYTAPVIQGKIPSGQSRITGSESIEEAKLLEIVLKAGALPAPVEVIEERTVGPSLGEDSVSQGLNAALIGFLLVVLFMIVYYKGAGSIADLALLFTIVFIFGILAAFRFTLTLPGIAGIVLTIGMAVDANVIIFERIREEMAVGKTLKAAIDSGFSNSMSAIFDSNITTFFTGIILYQFGSGPVQGFALTLMIGIASSLFSALVITRVVLDMLINKGYKVNLG